MGPPAGIDPTSGRFIAEPRPASAVPVAEEGQTIR